MKKPDPVDAGRLALSSFVLTNEPMRPRNLRTLPRDVRNEIENLFATVSEDPRAAIPRLLKLIKKYPHVPVLYNFLSAACERAGDSKRAMEVNVLCYRKHPDYLFSRVNYALACLLGGNPEKVPEIFEDTFDLKALYPKRRKFHVSEFLSFYCVVCMYFNEVGRRDEAEAIYRVLNQLDPLADRTVMARVALYPSWKDRLRKWLLKKTMQEVVANTKKLEA